MSEVYDVIIIGAGIGGLSAGLHLADRGYKTLILESHITPGGLCTSYERRGFTFDTCIHYLVGCGEDGVIRHPLQRFNLLQEMKLKRLERFATVRTPDSEFTAGDDFNEFERFLCRLCPADEKKLMGFFKQVRSLPKMVMPSPEDRRRHLLKSLGMLLSYWPMLPLNWRYGKLTYEMYLQRFQDGEKIRPYLEAFADDHSVLVNFYMYSWLYRKDLWAPQITSLEFSRAFASRFAAMGGEIRYRSKVAKVLVRDGKATGVRLEDGEEISARAVVSNADGYQTLFGLLGRELVLPALGQFYDTAPLFGSVLLISLGLGTKITTGDAPANVAVEWVMPGPASNRLDNLQTAPLTYKIDSLYNTAVAPEGKSVILVEAGADYGEWESLRQNPERYKEAKQKVQEIAISRAEKFFPQIKGRVEVADVATPVTFERYTSNREGSIMGWKPTPELMRRMSLPMRPTGLPNFFMVGQWTSVGGGIPPSIMGGEKVAGMVTKVLH